MITVINQSFSRDIMPSLSSDCHYPVYNHVHMLIVSLGIVITSLCQTGHNLVSSVLTRARTVLTRCYVPPFETYFLEKDGGEGHNSKYYISDSLLRSSHT